MTLLGLYNSIQSLMVNQHRGGSSYKQVQKLLAREATTENAQEVLLLLAKLEEDE